MVLIVPLLPPSYHLCTYIACKLWALVLDNFGKIEVELLLVGLAD
jgi:hypothetical protein